jgi:asparagine synthetase B (glutamine-hydrolysing)
MCGLLLLLAAEGEVAPSVVAHCLAQLAARGPDASRLLRPAEAPQLALGFARLAINGLSEAGMQPFVWPGGDGGSSAARFYSMTNGEKARFIAWQVRIALLNARRRDLQLPRPGGGARLPPVLRL